MTIKAKGKFNNRTVEVEIKDSKILFNGESNKFYEDILNLELSQKYIIGGTYVPETENDPPNIYNVLENHFFDKLEFISTDEPLEFPYKEGVIY